MNAMGRCLISDSGTTITVNGETVSNNLEVETSFGSDISVTFNQLSGVLYYYVVATQGVVVQSTSSSNSGTAKCGDSLKYFQSGSLQRSFTLGVDPDLDQIEFELIRGSGYGQMHGTRVIIINADKFSVVTDSPTLEPTTTTTTTKEPTAEPTTATTLIPTKEPTVAKIITDSPTLSPTERPSPDPTADPTKAPTFEPTQEPCIQCAAPAHCGCDDGCIVIPDQCYECGRQVCLYSDVSAEYVVVGAGPAGSYAAYELSKRTDKSILLLEWGVTDEEDDWYGVPAGDTQQHAGLMWSQEQKNYVVWDEQFTQSTITGGNQMHNGMVFTQMPYHDIDQLNIGWTEDFYNDVFNTMKNDITVTWDPIRADYTSMIQGFEVQDSGRQLTGKVTGVNWMMTCARGVCNTGTAWVPDAQRADLGEYRMERETWYKQLVKNNAQIEVRAFRQSTKVDSLVLEDGTATGLRLTNGTIIRVGRSVILSGGVLGTPEILLRTSELSNAFVGENFHHHKVYYDPYILCANCGSCEDQYPQILNYISSRETGYFKFQIYCTNEVKWYYIPAVAHSRGRMYINEEGEYKIDAPASYHEDDIPYFTEDLREFTGLLEASGLTSAHASWGEITEDVVRGLYSNAYVVTDTWHFGGSCSAGTCADERLKVQGTSNVYIGDASGMGESYNSHGVGVTTFFGAAAARFAVEDAETESPTESPTDSPTQKPISSSPTVNPSPQPTDVPTYRPTYEDCLTLSRTEEQLTCLKNKIEVLSQRCDANQEYQNSCESMRDDIRSILRN
jgi:choline dehydrogenase-like flavoprotein